MINAKVREDVTAKDTRTLYMLAVAANNSKAPHTRFEYVQMVTKLRTEYGLSIEAVANIFGKSTVWVTMYSNLAKLHPDVLKMFAEADESSDDDTASDGQRGRRKPTLPLLLAQHLLVFPQQDQLKHATHIREEGMDINEGRRYLINCRRNAGIETVTPGRGRPIEQFKALQTLVKRSLQTFGVYSDMREPEVVEMLRRCRLEERRIVRELIVKLQSELGEIQKKIAAPVVVQAVPQPSPLRR